MSLSLEEQSCCITICQKYNTGNWMVKDLWHWGYKKALRLLQAILKSAAVSLNIHLRLNWEMTTVSVMFRIKGHMLDIIWHPGHLITDEASTPDHISIFWKNMFYDRCYQRCKQLIALTWLPRRDTAWCLGFTSYTVMACLIPHLHRLPCFCWMPICLSPTYHRTKDEKPTEPA